LWLGIAEGVSPLWIDGGNPGVEVRPIGHYRSLSAMNITGQKGCI